MFEVLQCLKLRTLFLKGSSTSHSSDHRSLISTPSIIPIIPSIHITHLAINFIPYMTHLWCFLITITPLIFDYALFTKLV